MESLAYDRAFSGSPLIETIAVIIYFQSVRRAAAPCRVGIEFPPDCYLRDIMPDMCALGYAARRPQGYLWLPAFQEVVDFDLFQQPAREA